MSTKPKQWTREQIESLLMVSDAAVIRALLTLYRFQTTLEVQSQNTFESNGKGFNKFDAEKFSKLAEKANQNRITKKEIRWLRAKNRICKYSGQLLAAANWKMQLIEHRIKEMECELYLYQTYPDHEKVSMKYLDTLRTKLTELRQLREKQGPPT